MRQRECREVWSPRLRRGFLMRQRRQPFFLGFSGSGNRSYSSFHQVLYASASFGLIVTKMVTSSAHSGPLSWEKVTM